MYFKFVIIGLSKKSILNSICLFIDHLILATKSDSTILDFKSYENEKNTLNGAITGSNLF